MITSQPDSTVPTSNTPLKITITHIQITLSITATPPSIVTIIPQSEFITATVPLIVRIIPEVVLPPLITETSPSQSSQLYFFIVQGLFKFTTLQAYMDLH